jgi:hypothetical protein
MFGGLFVIPVPFPQYCLTFIPLFAVLAGTFLVRVVGALGVPLTESVDPPTRAAWVVATALFVTLACIGLSEARPVIRTPWLYPAAVGFGLAGVCSVRWHGRQHLSLAAALLVMALYPAQWTTWMWAEGDDGQFAQLRYVWTHTHADSTVLDGFSGLGVFRLHAWYYWMLHPGVRAMLPPPVAAGFEADLADGRVQPDLVVLDSNLRALSPAITKTVESRYHPTGLGDIYLRDVAAGALRPR